MFLRAARLSLRRERAIKRERERGRQEGSDAGIRVAVNGVGCGHLSNAYGWLNEADVLWPSPGDKRCESLRNIGDYRHFGKLYIHAVMHCSYIQCVYVCSSLIYKHIPSRLARTHHSRITGHRFASERGNIQPTRTYGLDPNSSSHHSNFALQMCVHGRTWVGCVE